MGHKVVPTLAPQAPAVAGEERSCDGCVFSMGTYCAARKVPLRGTDWTDSEVEFAKKYYASSCSMYSTLPEAAARDHRDPEQFFVPLEFADESEEWQKVACRTCAKCAFLIPPREFELRTKTKTPVFGFCAVRGEAIAYPTTSADGCQTRRPGEPIDLTLYPNIVMLPDFNIDFIRKIMESSAAEDPKMSPSGLPVGFDPTVYVGASMDGDEEMGIRTWVEVFDPMGTGNSISVPIFRRDFFPPDEREKIPDRNDSERPGDYIDHTGSVYRVLVAWLELEETPNLIGPAGVGKTELYRHLAWIMQLPFERISITASTELDDLAGKMRFENNETVYQYGRLTAAWSKPCVVALDEPNVGPPDVWQFLRPLTDNSKQLKIDANRGETILRSDCCFLGMSMNPYWDTRNAGAMSLADADQSRLLHIFMDLPPREVEMQIIRDRCLLDGWEIPEPVLGMVMQVANDIRALVKEDTLQISWGVRLQIKVARLLRWFAPLDAYKMASADALEPDSQVLLLDTVRTNIPSIDTSYLGW